MSQNENGNTPSPDNGAALVATQQPALAPASLHGSGIGLSATSVGQDVLKGGMDKSGLYHSLRRRWLLASSMGLLVGSIAAFTLWSLLPETNSATAQYEVSSSPLTLIDKGSTMQTKEFDIYKSTQVAYLKSPLVLMTALGANDGAISRFPMFKDIPDPERVEWLSDQLQVSFPAKGELLQITMAGPYPKQDLKKVVEAVCKAYYDVVIFEEQSNRARPEQILQSSLKTIAAQVQDKMETYQSLAKDSGASAAYAGSLDPETKMMLTEVQNLQKRRAIIQSELSDASMQFKIFETQMNDPDYIKQMADEALQNDPNLASMKQEMLYYEMQIRNLRSTVKRGTSPQIRSIERQMQQLQQEIAQVQEQMRAQIAGERSNDPNPMLKMQTTSYQIMRATMQANLTEIENSLEELKQNLLLKAENNTDLMLKLAEIEQLQQVQQSIALKIQNLRVENLAPNRVRPIGRKTTGGAQAETFENRNRFQRFAISAVGGIAASLLTCFGIGFMEFSSRRLNGPDQVDEGLGIRVIGTLPSLSSKKSLDPKNPVFAQLNESIDSLRTALMHESTKKKRQLVLITSPETKEGRSVVASQLAASLAKAGRRTLLVDGDLRSPDLHKFFNAPLEDGLSEVLRAEAEVTDVIRPTQAEGLWLMTAGYCDSDAVKALATDQAQPIFEKLRGDYDFIIIDGPPVIGLSDSLLFGQHCDGAILSVLRDRSGIPKIHQSVEQLRGVGVRLIGAVVNGVACKTDRRVTHLQQVSPKAKQKQLETIDG